MPRTAALLVFLIAWLGTPQPGLTEESENKATPWKRAGLNLGVFFAGTNSSVSIGLGGLGVSVDVEDALGLETTTSAGRIDGFWRFTENKRHRVDFTWFALRRDGLGVLERDIQIGDQTYPAGSTVNSSLDFDIYKSTYSYSFIQDDRFDLAGSVGLYVAPISFSISSTSGLVPSESADVTAPLPVIGLRMDFAITPKWFIRASTEAFYLEIDDYRGTILDFRGAIEYDAFKHVGFGLGFDLLSVSVEARESTDIIDLDFNGQVDFDYAGLQAYVKFFL